MMREVSFQTHNINSSAVRQNRSLDSTRVVDAGESNSRATRNILVAIDALLRVNRIDCAIQILETELGRGC